MDESSPVFENFSNKMSAMNSRPKINRTTFNIGANVLEKKVANNSRKITIIKSILKNQKVDIGEKLTTPEPDKSAEVSKELASVNSTLLSIGNILSADFTNRIAIEKGQNKLLKDQKQKRKRSLAESGIETVKKVGKGLGKLTSPLQQGGSNILKALSLLGLGVAGNVAFNLLENFDSEKFKKILDSIKKNFKWVVGTVGILTGLLAIKGVLSAIAAIKATLAFLASPPVLIALATAAGIIAADKLFNKVDESIDKKFIPNLKDKVEKKQGMELSAKQEEGFDELSDAMKNNMRYQFAMGAFGISGVMDRSTVEAFKRSNIGTVQLPPIIEKLHKNRKPIIPLPASDATNVVPYATSINVENDHMTKTPKIHGIIL